MSDTPDRPSDLSRIFCEILVRRQLGESPILDEYCQRFPDLAEQLRLHVRLYDALGEAGEDSWRVASGGWREKTPLLPPPATHHPPPAEEQPQRTGNPHVLALLEEMLHSGKTPEEACLDCPELLPEVLRRRQEFCLINAQVDALLSGLRTDQGAVAIGPGLPSAGLPQVPGYEVQAVLGRGGMGVVYRATDRTLGREVAVKVLLACFATNSATARRFADEARITAQLQHPGIPPVHEVGTLPDGRPFLAMKLIDGQTLDALLASRPEPSADRGRFVAVFDQLCQAVAYAHAHGVIHRDLKPGNVMVGAFGEVQVMDWGLAKVLGARPGEQTDPEQRTATAVCIPRESDDPLTLSGSVLGTPAFMAPEQAVGAVAMIDRRSDVFGLGAVLAVVLTGRPPFVADTAEATRAIAARGDVGECFARLGASGADPDLVALCQRCLAPRPEDRPADAGEVAKAVAALRAVAEERARRAELERVEALARVAEQRRRRRLLLAASGVIALVLLAGLSVSLLQMRRAMQAEDDANTNANRAQDEAKEKALALVAEQKARRQAFDALDSITGDLVERKFVEGAMLTEDDRAFLRGIIAQLQAFAAIPGDDIGSREMQALGRFRVARMRYFLGELKEAEQDYDQAVNLHKQLVADFPSRPEFRQRVALSHNNRGLLLRGTGRLPEAEQDYSHAVSIHKQLAADFPSRPELHQDLASIYLNRGSLLLATGRLKEAEEDFDQALNIQNQLATDFPFRHKLRQDLASIYLNRGNLLHSTGRLKEAEKGFDQAVSLHKRLAADFPSRPEFRQRLALSHLNRGLLLRDTGRLKEAEQDYIQALNIRQQLAAEFPSRPEFREDLASSHLNRGHLLSDTGRLKEAEKDYDQAVSLFKQLTADFPSRPELRRGMAGSHLNRGVLLSDTGRLKEAEQDFGQALSIQKQLAADFPSRPEFRQDLAKTHLDRGNLLHAVSRLREAEKDYDQAVGIYKQLAADFPSVPEYRQELASSLSNRGVLLRATGRFSQAEKDCDQALRIQKQLAADFPSVPEFRHGLATSYNNRARLLYTAGRLPEALKDYAQAVSLYKQLAADFPSRPEFRRDLAMSHNGRGGLLSDTGRLPEAAKDYDEAVSIQKRLVADFPSRPEFRKKLATSHNNRGLLLQKMDRLQEAEKDYDQAVSLQKQLVADFSNQPEFFEDLARSYNNRGIVLDKTGRRQEAVKDYEQSLNIKKQLADESSNQPDRRNELAATYVNLAFLHLQLGNWAAAQQLLLEGRPHHLAALKASPLHPTYRQFYRNNLTVLIAAHAGLLDQPEAVRTAETCRNLGWRASEDAYSAACGLCHSVTAVAKHDKLDAKQREAAAQFYSDAAMKALREAVSKGYKDVKNMKTDTDLDPLRQREDFQRLVADLEGKGK